MNGELRKSEFMPKGLRHIIYGVYAQQTFCSIINFSCFPWVLAATNSEVSWNLIASTAAWSCEDSKLDAGEFTSASRRQKQQQLIQPAIRPAMESDKSRAGSQETWRKTNPKKVKRNEQTHHQTHSPVKALMELTEWDCWPRPWMVTPSPSRRLLRCARFVVHLMIVRKVLESS